MDGRMVRKCCVLGFVLAAAVGCDRRARQQNPFGDMPSTGQPVANMPTPKRALWGGGSPPPNVPVEMAPDAATAKKPPTPETLVAMSDARLDAAFDPKTAPGSKEALLDLARVGYQKALQQDPKNKTALKGMGQYYARVGDREKAVEVYKKYLTLYPKDADVAHEVAVAHARWKDMDGAVAWCEFALKIDPENRAVKKTMGFCLARAGKWDEAFTVLSQIMPEAQVRHNLAGMLDHMGHTEASKSQLHLALKADPNYAPPAGFLAELDQPRDPNPVRQTGDQQPAP